MAHESTRRKNLERKKMASDIVLDFMEKHNIPLTRENYLDVAFMGTPPEELDAEEELSLPEMFQKNPPIEYDEE
jgi:hypothetical protein